MSRLEGNPTIGGERRVRRLIRDGVVIGIFTTRGGSEWFFDPRGYGYIYTQETAVYIADSLSRLNAEFRVAR